MISPTAENWCHNLYQWHFSLFQLALEHYQKFVNRMRQYSDILSVLKLLVQIKAGAHIVDNNGQTTCFHLTMCHPEGLDSTNYTFLTLRASQTGNRLLFRIKKKGEDNMYRAAVWLPDISLAVSCLWLPFLMFWSSYL